MRNLDVGLNADGVVNMIHDYTQVGSAQPCVALLGQLACDSVQRRLPACLPD